MSIIVYTVSIKAIIASYTEMLNYSHRTSEPGSFDN